MRTYRADDLLHFADRPRVRAQRLLNRNRYSCAFVGYLLPLERDAWLVCYDSFVEVIFKPTSSHYTFDVLTDRRLSPGGPILRHTGVTGDTGEYPSSEVRLMARRLAEQALASRR